MNSPNWLHQVVTVRDGMDAMAYLRQEGEYADAPRPDLILLDLNLPKKDGREVLAEIIAKGRGQKTEGRRERIDGSRFQDLALS